MSIKTLILEINERINLIKEDKYIDKQKKAIIIRENKRILVRCQQLILNGLSK